jgi:hypothetical protein
MPRFDVVIKISTEALLDRAREGRWSKSEQIGVYL